MKASPRAAISRLSILLLATCAASFIWESARDAGLQPVSGKVTKVRPVFAGRTGDNKEFTIRYVLDGKEHYLVTRRGILDSLGSLRNLKRGDTVPIAANPKPPYRAVLDTLTGRYAVTLSFGVLAGVFFAAMTVLGLSGRLPRRG